MQVYDVPQVDKRMRSTNRRQQPGKGIVAIVRRSDLILSDRRSCSNTKSTVRVDDRAT